MIRTLCFLLFLIFSGSCFGQVAHWDYNPRAFHYRDKLTTLYSDSVYHHSSIRYIEFDFPKKYIVDTYYRNKITYLENTYSITPDTLSPSKSLWKKIYEDQYHFLKINHPDFSLLIDPIINISMGQEDGTAIFQNTRGIKLSGNIDKKVYFYTSLYENQRSFLSYINRRILRWNHIPGQGFFKPYNSKIVQSFEGWDFLNAQAFFGFNISKSIDIQLGYGNNFIGDGYRSMLLSDYGHNYFNIKLNTQIWRLHYQNIFAELSPISSLDNAGDNLLPKKYMAAHYLDFVINPKLSIGIYEAVIFSRTNHFEFQYLNPLILYRSIEQFLDSPDNVLIGLNFKGIIGNKTQLYSQLMVDEFRSDQIFSGNGWWGNKIAYQVGLKYFDIANIKNLDLQLEYNHARPYTYTHRIGTNDSFVTTSYSHFNQALAHPLGANFKETIGILKYEFNQKWFFNLRYVYTTYGDSSIDNVGFDILQDYETRAADFGNFTGQGVQTTVSLFNFDLSYQFHPNYYLDFEFIRRKQNSQSLSNNITYWGVGVRANMANKKIDY